MNKKIKLTLISLGVSLLPVVALAQSTPSNSLTMVGVINAIETALWIVFGCIAVVCFVVAGILFLTSAGVPEKIAAARSAFIWGVAGVIVGIIAYSIITIVTSVIH